MTSTGTKRDIGYLITQVHRKLYAELEQVLEHESLTVEQWRVLEVLADRDGCAMSELAVLVLMNHPALTKLADRMVASGLIHRVADPADQRRVLVHSTERGSAIFYRARDRVLRHNDRVEAVIGSARSAELKKILQQMAGETPKLAAH